MASVQTISPKTRKPAKVPEYLIKEVLDGLPVYYKGYKAVLRKEKSLEEIMGASGLQLFIIRYLFRLLDRRLDENLFYVFTGEGGLHIGKGNNVAGDILVYEKQKLTPNFIDEHYLQIPPFINIEIDVEIDNANFTDYEYIDRKTKNLLTFGVQKVLWILTKTKQVIVAEPGQNWLVIDWHKDIEIFDGITFNIPAYLEKEGIPVE
ncbi:Uma2 family endonuclease [Runella sp.]|jgi:Uma2 family endonuclease|uniref:Uma2 family endonuclease n=1 Tax=Runella sp. TaxID=1960881 RepID=UPI00261682B2|nr:Uma2 family endonuclease [Runella sp.]